MPVLHGCYSMLEDLELLLSLQGKRSQPVKLLLLPLLLTHYVDIG